MAIEVCSCMYLVHCMFCGTLFVAAVMYEMLKSRTQGNPSDNFSYGQ